ncbi:hypothetical protein E4T39_08662 [Aureobasidium subglaciale]|nr:hypothetical protein E4T39_08662 [Aureobasidium subglaciale]
MEQIDEDNSEPWEAPRLVCHPNLEKKLSKPQRSLQYHLMEQKITRAITEYKAGKYASLAEAGRAHGIIERAGYFRLRARAAGRASKSDRLKNGSQRLSPEQETTLCRYVDGLDDHRALHRKIGEKAYSMLCEELTSYDPPPRPLGKQWPARFLERNPGIMASRQKPLTSPMSGEIASPIPGEEVGSTETTNGKPQLLPDCQRFLDRPTETGVTPSQISTTCTAPAESQNVLIITSETDSIDRDVASPTASPPDRPSMGSSATNSFFSSIQSSLAEYRMTFSSRLT